MGRRPSIGVAEIVETVRELGGYCTKAQLYKRLREKGYTIATNTFYNLLKRLEEQGVVRVYKGKGKRGSTHYVFLSEEACNQQTTRGGHEVIIGHLVECKKLIELLREVVVAACKHASSINVCLESVKEKLEKIEEICPTYRVEEVYIILKSKMEQQRINRYRKLKRDLFKMYHGHYNDYYYL